MVQAWSRPGSGAFVTAPQLRLVLKVLLPALGLVVATQWLGLYASAALYIALYMRGIGGHSWVAAVACGAGVAVVSFLVFDQWFLVPMPKGPLEMWLGY
jgi:hypothetical protein